MGRFLGAGRSHLLLTTYLALCLLTFQKKKKEKKS